MEPLLIVAAILMVIGIIGSVVPVIPGPALSFAGLVLLFVEKGSDDISLFSLILFAIMMALLIVIDYVAPILGAKFAGASKDAIIWAICGALLGIIIFPLLGIFIGAIVGAIIGEMQSGKKFGEAAKAGVGVVVGGAMTIILQLAYSVVAAIYFFVKVI